MPFIHFSKEQLHNLDFSLSREFLLANQNGSYCSSSLSNCNTRKYHGLLVAPQPMIDDNKHVLLSSLDETILQGHKKKQLGTHCYPNTIYPEGYKCIDSFSYDRTPQWTLRTDDFELRKEILIVEEEDRVLIRYTVKESKAPFILQCDPFLAFRNIHSLAKVNGNVSHKFEKIANGIKLKMYSGYSGLFFQYSKKSIFIPAQNWHYNNEYYQERERGYEYKEDLYCPGHFIASLKKGDHLIFSAGLTEISPRKLKGLFESQLKKRISLKSYEDCLKNAAQQLIIQTKKGTEITAGYHWFEQWGRDTFIALPGLTLSTGQPKTCKAILDTTLKDLKQGLFPNMGKGPNAAYNTADASLWFFWALQQYAITTKSISNIWNEYGSKMKSILDNYRNGTQHHIHMLENGLLYAGESGNAVTWMDAVVDGKPVTSRIGITVELNALWYNAICFSLEAAKFANDEEFKAEWKSIPPLIEVSFKNTFWSEEKRHLADFVNNQFTDWSMRPNQVIAASLPYSPIDSEIKKALLEKVTEKLLTPRGLRTLSPDDKEYKGIYFGNQNSRDLAYHQGTVWPWLLGHYAEACLKTFGESAKQNIQTLYENFASATLEYGIGTIAEIYDGDKPHKARGTISQAWSVAELLRIKSMLAIKQKNNSSKIKKVASLQTF